ncbi:DUF4870 domain-containing protein [Streptomyces inhibens]|uniref:DUF4870 domain-containing protein n=1 Tax=Streptomyces inhibens TaxID=2293571 RepID=UPI00402A75D9
MSDYHQPGYGPYTGGPQQPYGPPQQGWQQATPPVDHGNAYGYGYGYTYGTPPPAPSTSAAMWSHLGALLTITAGTAMCCGLGAFLGWIFPMSIRGNERHRHDPYVRHHATQALNFGITQAVMAALGVLLYFVSAVIFATAATETQRNGAGLAVPLLTVIGIMAAYGIAGMVCAVIGTVKATRGELWTYPRLIAWPLSKG